MAWTLATATLIATVGVAVDGDEAPMDLTAGEQYQLDAAARGELAGDLNTRWWACRFDSGRTDLPTGHNCATLPQWGGLLGPSPARPPAAPDVIVPAPTATPPTPGRPAAAAVRRAQPHRPVGAPLAPRPVIPPIREPQPPAEPKPVDPGPGSPSPSPICTTDCVPVDPSPPAPRPDCADAPDWLQWIDNYDAESWQWDPACYQHPGWRGDREETPAPTPDPQPASTPDA
ncbi:hypothetical protein GCM10010123_23840 [Pilimelia anulata]|uniref:Uncharacterized protein n=2 Tax=Pilimelia anulata TaxID=53371 RepID=A0A8J3BAJ2_9ACTN|nr:hypothetical protein GCM10010123_23840 [Pilimelia anulata]